MKISKARICLLLLILIGSLSLALTPVVTQTGLASSLWDIQEGKDELPEPFGYPSSGDPPDVRDVTIRVIRVFLTFVGLIFIIMILVAGYQWMTAGGSQEKVGVAKKRIINGVIGFFIIAAAYAFTFFITEIMYEEIFDPF
jgi:hypothetical protein